MERETKGKSLEKTLRIEVTLKGDYLSSKTIHLTHTKTVEQLAKAVDHLNSVKIKQGAASTDDWKVLALSLLSPEDLQKCLALMSSKAKAKYRKSVGEENYTCLALDIATLCTHIIKALEPWSRRVKV